MILRAARVQNRVGVAFCEDSNPKEDGGDIDLITLDIPQNYIIGIKVSCREKETKENAYEGLKELMGYLRDHPRSFTKVVGKQCKLFLIGLGFEIIDSSARLTNSIAVPYIDDKLLSLIHISEPTRPY